MKYIPHVDNWVQEYHDSLKEQRKKRLVKKLRQIAKWNKSSLKPKKKS
jgi:hypothetical protein